MVESGISQRQAAKLLGVSHTAIQKDMATKLPKAGNKVATTFCRRRSMPSNSRYSRLEKAAAKERKRQGARNKTGSGKLPEAAKGETRDKVALTAARLRRQRESRQGKTP